MGRRRRAGPRVVEREERRRPAERRGDASPGRTGPARRREATRVWVWTSTQPGQDEQAGRVDDLAGARGQPRQVGLDGLDRARRESRRRLAASPPRSRRSRRGSAGPARARRSSVTGRRVRRSGRRRQARSDGVRGRLEDRVAAREVVGRRVRHGDVGLDRDPLVVGRAPLPVARRDEHVLADRTGAAIRRTSPYRFGLPPIASPAKIGAGLAARDRSRSWRPPRT